MRSQLLIYTAVTDGYDLLRPPMPQPHINARCVAFVKCPDAMRNRCHTFELRQVCQKFSEPNRNAKIHKMLPHIYFPRASYSLWIDGNIELGSLLPTTFIEQSLEEADVAVFHHTRRRCLYSEASTCIEAKLDNPNIIMAQVVRYTQEGYLGGQGLASGSIILRRHTPRVASFNECWWKEIQRGSRRDQISLNYAAHMTQVRLAYFPNSLRHYFKRKPHANAHGRIWTDFRSA
jgi:hypothetical protein